MMSYHVEISRFLALYTAYENGIYHPSLSAFRIFATFVLIQ